MEFGLCKQQNEEGGEEVKAFGAGLLSSFGELKYCLSDEPEKRPFDPELAAMQKYPITAYQPVYFVADSFERAKRQLRDFAQTLQRPCDLFFDPVTQCIVRLDSAEKIGLITASLVNQLSRVSDALKRI